MKRKKLNLLPQEVKNKYANRYITYAASALCGICILILVIQYIHIGILHLQISDIVKNNEMYQKEQETIETLKVNIKNHRTFMTDYESKCFPLMDFMYDLEARRPADLFIISVDSSDRLINEGADEKDTESKEQGKDETKEEKTDEDKLTEITYRQDLAGEQIVIRGYSANQESLSNFIYDITHFSYIGSAKITAIEEHTIENGRYNIFEIVVTGGVQN